MNADRARALFERALDGELDRQTREAFETALREDRALREEYAVLESLRQATRDLGRSDALSNVDLLAGVQQKLRARSGGKFYRDRFSERQGLGNLPWIVGLASLLVAAVCGWLLLTGW